MSMETESTVVLGKHYLRRENKANNKQRILILRDIKIHMHKET